MPSFSRNNVVLVRFPFSDLSNAKIRPAVVVSSPHVSQDIFVVALTSKKSSLRSGEFVLNDWSIAGLNVETALKRAVFSIREQLVLKTVGTLSNLDIVELNESLRVWFGLD